MAAQSDAQALKASLLAGDQQAAEGQLKDLRQHSENASERTDSATWSVLEVLPVFGDDAKGVQVVSSVLDDLARDGLPALRSEEHTSELQSLMRISYAVFCLKTHKSI